MKPWMMLALGVAFLGATQGLLAQSEEEDLFGDQSTSEQTGVATSNSGASADVAGRFLGDEAKLQWTGELQYSATNVWKDASPDLTQDLSFELGLTARPDRNMRVGAKGQWNYDPGTGKAQVNVSEAFGDFQGGDKLYIRVGKQFIQWGRGFFYSPADVLNLTTIDPADPTATREGPTSFKATWEEGEAGSYQAVVTANEITKGDKVSLAGQGTWLLWGSEISVGGYYQPSQDRAPRGFLTAGFNLHGVNFYSESVVLAKNDERRLKKAGSGLAVAENPSGWVAQQTVGFTYTWEEPDKRFSLEALGQYYYNGTGAEDPAVYHQRSQFLPMLINTGDLKAGDLRNFGTQYVAGSVAFNKIAGSTVSLSDSFRASLSQESWVQTPRLEWMADPNLTLGGESVWSRGAKNSEYAQGGDTAAWQLDAILFDKLTVEISGPLPGSQNSVNPTLKVSLRGMTF